VDVYQAEVLEVPVVARIHVQRVQLHHVTGTAGGRLALPSLGVGTTTEAPFARVDGLTALKEQVLLPEMGQDPAHL